MMEGAFFVSRSDLLQWVNGLLQVNLTKVEQCASGAIYCQIIDSCQPGSVAMRKVNWMARAEHEYIPNYKALQVAFDKLDIERNIPVDQLIRAKYQDNLEFLQWVKCFWEREGGLGRLDYDPVAAREGKTLPAWAKPAGNVLMNKSPPGACEKENFKPRAPVARTMEVEKKPVPRPAPRQPVQTAARTPRSVNSSLNNSLNTSNSAETEALKVKVEAQNEELIDLRGNLDGLERERDYYFRKLRDVEILCLTLKAKMDPELTAEKVVEDVQGILYAENDDEVDEEISGSVDGQP